jgi:prevent-host-death family protein
MAKATPRTRSAGGASAWKLEDAKARFSEVVRLARERGPQLVSVRGRDAVVILAAEDYARLAPAATSTTLAALFANSPLARLENFDRTLLREIAPMREPPDLSA